MLKLAMNARHHSCNFDAYDSPQSHEITTIFEVWIQPRSFIKLNSELYSWNKWSICSSLICVKSSHIECLWPPPFWWGQMISLIIFAASSASTLDGARTKAWGWWWVCARDSSSTIGHGDAISESIISGLLGGSSRCVISDMSSASGPMASMLHGGSARALSLGTHSISSPGLSRIHLISQQASPNACLISLLFVLELLTASGGSQGMEVLGLGLWCEWKKSHIICFFPSACVFLIGSWTSFSIALHLAA